MSADPIYNLLVDDLLWLRRQRGSFDTRLTSARGFIDTVGGGSLRVVRNEMTRIRRLHADDPDSDIAAYFATAGYRTPGESLDQRLKDYAARHFVVERTALRRSDRGARALARLLRDGLRHERPWAYLIVVQREDRLDAFADFVLRQGMEYREPVAYVAGERVELRARIDDMGAMTRDAHRNRLPTVKLDTSVDEDTPLATLSITWVPEVAPTWDLVSSMADDRIYARITLEPQPMATVEVRWWDEFAANTRERALARGRV